MKKRSIAGWIEYARKRGWLLNNLYEQSDGWFAANFRKGDKEHMNMTDFTAFGKGSTPHKAIEQSLKDGSAKTPRRHIRRHRKRKRLNQ